MRAAPVCIGRMSFVLYLDGDEFLAKIRGRSRWPWTMKQVKATIDPGLALSFPARAVLALLIEGAQTVVGC